MLCSDIWLNCSAEASQRRPLTAEDVIKINKSSIWRAVTPHKYPSHSEITMSPCLLLTAGSVAHVIYRSAQNGSGPTKTWYLKPFHEQYTSLARSSFGAVYNEFIQGSSAFELDQTAINPTLWNRTQSVLASVEGFQ